jgi:D-alanyl-D-alanine carboxypeptidase-like protein
VATAQNGWPVVTSAPDFVVDGVDFPNGVLAGDAQVVFRWLVRQYSKRVEIVHAGGCWGFDHKKISGSDEWSCHAAALAIDINAPAHNMGDPPSHSMSQHQIDECHALERESDGVLRWGGDFSRPDTMHWEVVGTPAQLHKLANKIKGEIDVTEAELKTAIREVLADFFASGDQGDADHSATSKIGRDALNQGIPNPLSDDGGKTPAWQLLRDIAAKLK